MRNWMKLFNSKILDRGYDYYKTGMITSLKITDYGYKALVDGTKEYEVKIYLEDDEIKDMDCSCPYAKGGDHCKHMAAVLYELNDVDFDPENIEIEDEISESTEDIESMVQSVSENELKDFFIHLAKENEDVKNAFLARFSSFDDNQLQLILSKIYQITDRYEHNGYINYNNAWNYGHEMSMFLQENASVLIGRKKLNEAFQLVNKVFLEISSQELDDSDGIISMVADYCVDYWKEIIDLSDESFRHQMFHFFQKILKNELIVDYMEDVIERVLFESFHDISILEEKLEFLDSEISGLVKNYENGFLTSYNLSKFIRLRILVMSELEYSSEEIHEYRNQYRFLSTIRKTEIDEYMDQNDYEHAAEVLKESILLDKNYPGLVHDYKVLLIDVYYKMKDEKSYRMSLQDFVLNETQYDLKFILKLKAVCSKNEWKRWKETIIQNRRSTKISYYLMEHEGEYKRLFKEIKNAKNVYLLNEFEETLKDKFPEEMMKMYCDYVIAQAKNVSNRGGYKEIAGYLKKIKTYPNSDAVLDQIVSSFRLNYKKRPAMMDELRKAGF